MKKLTILFIGIFMSVFIMGCNTNSDNNDIEDKNKNDDKEDESELDLSTKKGIEKYISANWQNYGYSEKPVKYIAISFDDGPCPPSSYGGTAAMLELLEELKIKATFFVVGSNVRSNKSALKAIHEAGHEIGNHSDAYSSLGSSSIDVITASLNAASQAINEITGLTPNLFRAPNLNHGPNLSQVCADLNMALIDGNTHNDWPGSSPEIKNSALANPQDGNIILLHENNTSQGNTMKDLPDIISGLREKGFWIMTVSQLAIVKGKALEAGKRYSGL